MSTGRSACARMWLVAPPKIICRSLLWVNAAFGPGCGQDRLAGALAVEIDRLELRRNAVQLKVLEELVGRRPRHALPADHIEHGDLCRLMQKRHGKARGPRLLGAAIPVQ